MFSGSGDVGVLITCNGCGHVSSTDFGVVAERPGADFRILRIRVAIANRMVKLSHAHITAYPGESVGDFVRQLKVADSGQAHGREKLPDTAGHIIVLEIAFHINGHMKWNSGPHAHRDFLQLIQHVSIFSRRYADAEGLTGKISTRYGKIIF